MSLRGVGADAPGSRWVQCTAAGPGSSADAAVGPPCEPPPLAESAGWGRPPAVRPAGSAQALKTIPVQRASEAPADEQRGPSDTRARRATAAFVTSVVAVSTAGAMIGTVMGPAVGTMFGGAVGVIAGACLGGALAIREWLAN